MPIISGTTTGSIATVAYDIPCTIKSWSLSNTDGGSITVSITIVVSNGNDVVVYQGSIAHGETKSSDVPIILESGFYFIITTSASCDYYFSIS
jgi:hypothetical protein